MGSGVGGKQGVDPGSSQTPKLPRQGRGHSSWWRENSNSAASESVVTCLLACGPRRLMRQHVSKEDTGHGMKQQLLISSARFFHLEILAKDGLIPGELITLDAAAACGGLLSLPEDTPAPF